MTDINVTKAVWAVWNSLEEDHGSPVHTIAERLGITTAEVAAIVYPVETFGEWSDDQEPVAVDEIDEGKHEAYEMVVSAISFLLHQEPEGLDREALAMRLCFLKPNPKYTDLLLNCVGGPIALIEYMDHALGHLVDDDDVEVRFVLSETFRHNLDVIAQVRAEDGWDSENGSE